MHEGKKLLFKVQKNTFIITELKKQLKAIDEKKVNIQATDYSKDKIAGGIITAEDVLIAKIDNKTKLEERVDNLTAEIEDIQAVVLSLDDPNQLTVLYKKYFQQLSQKEIAIDLNYSKQNINKIHQKALDSFWDAWCHNHQKG